MTDGKVFLYGTGVMGKAAMLYREKFHKRLDAFVASNRVFVKENEEKICGYPIYYIDEIEPAESDVCILATTYLKDVIPLAHKKRWKIEMMSEDEWTIALNLARLKEEKIDYNSKFLEFGQFKVPNLYNIDSIERSILESFSMEMVDLVYPYLGNDNYIVEGCYEYGRVKLSKDDYVIDCGGNVGFFSAKAAYSGCHVIALEPLDKCVECIERINQLCNTNIIIIKKCVGKEKGKIEFTETESNIGASSMVIDRVGIKRTVDVTTIDEIVREQKLPRVDFIKADIEGAERLMLEGARNTLKEYGPKLSICTYHLWDDVQVLTELIKSANPNYVIQYAWKKLYAWIPEK